MDLISKTDKEKLSKKQNTMVNTYGYVIILASEKCNKLFGKLHYGKKNW